MDANRGRTRGRGEVDDDQAGVLEHLKCAVCLEAPQGRIEQCTNGHLLCSEAGDGDGTSCASRVRAVRGPTCPVCRHGLPDAPIRALSAEQTIATLPARCRHCSSSMQRGSLRVHEEVLCPRAPVVCAAEDCGCRWTGLRAEQDLHEPGCVWVVVKGQIGSLRETFEGQIRELKVSHANSELTLKGKIRELKLSHASSEEERKKSEEKQNKLHNDLQRDMLLRGATLGHLCTVWQLLDRTGLTADFVHPDHRGETMLLAASGNGHVAVVRFLIERSADVDLVRPDGTTPLFAAVQGGHSTVVEILLAHGANANLATSDLGHTLLYDASEEGHADIVEMLLGKGADVNQPTTDDGKTALHVASQHGHATVVEILLAHGANANLATSELGHTPLFIASDEGHADVVEILLGKGADVN